MSVITLKAHYDGQHILLDEPFDLPINTALTVTIALSENEQWTALSLQGLVSAYSDNEPDYSLDDIKQ